VTGSDIIYAHTWGARREHMIADQIPIGAAGQNVRVE
jgi:hypothetical protein